MDVFLCHSRVLGHDFPHRLRHAPGNPARFIIEAPDEAPHDGSGRLHVRVSQAGDNPADGPYRPPFHKPFRAAEESNKRIDDSTGGKLQPFRSPRLEMFGAQEGFHRQFQLPAAALSGSLNQGCLVPFNPQSNGNGPAPNTTAAAILESTTLRRLMIRLDGFSGRFFPLNTVGGATIDRLIDTIFGITVPLEDFHITGCIPGKNTRAEFQTGIAVDASTQIYHGYFSRHDVG